MNNDNDVEDDDDELGRECQDSTNAYRSRKSEQKT